MIMVTGGAGVLGSRLVKRLVEAGSPVRVLTLPGDPFVSRLDGVGCDIVYGDVADRASLAGLLDGVETVFHLAAVIITDDDAVYERVNVGGVRNMVELSLEAGVGHFVYVSSAAAEWPEGSAYARSKLAGENIVRGQDEMRYTIVRPTLIYERGGGQEFMMFWESLRRWPVVPFVGRGTALKSPVHADDIVQGLAAIAGNERAFGKTYNLSGGEELPIRDLARLMLRHQGLRRPIVPVPVPLCQAAALVMERFMKRPPLTRYGISRIVHDAALDNSAAREDLGYDPIGVTEGLERCYPVSSSR